MSILILPARLSPGKNHTMRIKPTLSVKAISQPLGLAGVLFGVLAVFSGVGASDGEPISGEAVAAAPAAKSNKDAEILREYEKIIAGNADSVFSAPVWTVRGGIAVM